MPEFCWGHILECADNGGALDYVLIDGVFEFFEAIIQSGVALGLPPHSKVQIILSRNGASANTCAMATAK